MTTRSIAYFVVLVLMVHVQTAHSKSINMEVVQINVLFADQRQLDLVQIVRMVNMRNEIHELANNNVQKKNYMEQIFQQFQDFISDSRLTKLIDFFKKSNDIFQLIEHGENQHSEILKWLLNPREGHGQGDAILKDFLTAAYWSAQENNNVLSNKEFFSTWTPSRISRTGFHSIFAKREYVLPSRDRLDLLMIDMENKIIVVVENKRNAKFNLNQLENYWEEVSKKIRKRPVFEEFLTCHVFLDKKYDEDELLASTQNRWSFLNYQWLEAGARRAEVQMQRGNHSSALVISYCQHQCEDYILPNEKAVNDILADLANEYRDLIVEIVNVSKLDLVELTPSVMNQPHGELWQFAEHYPYIISRLSEKTHLSYIESNFLNTFPGQKIDIEFGKNWLTIVNEAWADFIADEEIYYPINVLIRENVTGKFNVMICYRSKVIKQELFEQFNEAMENGFPELKKGKQGSKVRRLRKEVDISETEAILLAKKLYEKLIDVLKPTP